MRQPVYSLVFGRPASSIDGANFKVFFVGSYSECCAQRKVSGDLVLTPDGKVSQEDGWLFPWEKEDPNCYARKMQREGWTY